MAVFIVIILSLFSTIERFDFVTRAFRVYFGSPNKSETHAFSVS